MLFVNVRVNNGNVIFYTAAVITVEKVVQRPNALTRARLHSAGWKDNCSRPPEGQTCWKGVLMNVYGLEHYN